MVEEGSRQEEVSSAGRGRITLLQVKKSPQESSAGTRINTNDVDKKDAASQKKERKKSCDELDNKLKAPQCREGSSRNTIQAEELDSALDSDQSIKSKTTTMLYSRNNIRMLCKRIDYSIVSKEGVSSQH